MTARTRLLKFPSRRNLSLEPPAAVAGIKPETPLEPAAATGESISVNAAGEVVSRSLQTRTSESATETRGGRRGPGPREKRIDIWQ